MFLIQMCIYFLLSVAVFQLKSAKLILFLLKAVSASQVHQQQSLTKGIKLMRKRRTESYTLKIYAVN